MWEIVSNFVALLENLNFKIAIFLDNFILGAIFWQLYSFKLEELNNQLSHKCNEIYISRQIFCRKSTMFGPWN
jgi:hypothetical protein